MTFPIGRPISELLPIYLSYAQSDSSKFIVVNDAICVSKVNQLTLHEYIEVRSYVCLYHHDSDCTKCPPMLSAAKMIVTNSICPLPNIFKTFFPNVTYHSYQAKRRLLQMPLATIRTGFPSTGDSQIFIMEFFQGVNYSNLHRILELNRTSKPSLSINKKEVQELLLLSSSDRERETLKYAIFKVSGLTPTGARKKLGFGDMPERAARIEVAIQEIVDIRKAFDDIIEARVKTQVVLSSGSGEDDIDEDVSSSIECVCDQETSKQFDIILKQSLNWFEFHANVIETLEVPGNCIDGLLNAYHSQIGSCFTEEERKQIDLSFEAFWADEVINEKRKIRSQQLCNGDIVTDSESDDPSMYQKAIQTNCVEGENVITKKVDAIKRQVRRARAKFIANQHYLGKKNSKALHSIAEKFPDIGSEIESYVSSCNVGADAWRRTGVLTFDGNQKIDKKCTYQRIQNHLKDIYKQHISYGTVVQLCVARNKRRLSAKRYHGLAEVTSRRARKGFQLRYNPDCHWSAALYRNLNALQYHCGVDILNINRDDQAGFRLDTLATHHQYSTPVVKGEDVLTTYTDYVNRYPSVLQTTSYSFSRTSNTDEYCAGVTKAQSLFTKCPAQHAADIEFLFAKESLRPVFFNTATGNEKAIDCIRVDGAADEGPSHEEVQFCWTEWHVHHRKVATLVTTRSSGSSYMNRVELQNGCLTRAHSGLFIPSTLHGSCVKENGKVNESILHQNLDSAIDIYIKRCDQCSCGKTVIHLFKGLQADYERRKKLITFLKGTKTQKQLLKDEHPALYEHFSEIWDIRTRHMVLGLPTQYVFFLRCCLAKECKHPLCSILTSLPPWYVGGPPLTFFPLPVPDNSQPFGDVNCSRCKGVCSGHYLKPESLDNMKLMAAKPPSTIISEENKAHSNNLSELEVKDLAKRVLLPVSEINIWLEHLEEVSRNRKEGAIKAAETRKRKKMEKQQEKSDDILCGVCSGQWEEETDEVEQWIQCEKCRQWYHWKCVNVSEEPEQYYCGNCV